MRSISQIYSEAVYTRNSYLQITELDSGRSNGKLSILNLITYVVAVCIHTYEAILDLFQIRILEVLNSRVNGTPPWYVNMVKKFQYNSDRNIPDELEFNEDTMKLQYVTPDSSRRIVDEASWEVDYDEESLTLKAVKKNSDEDSIAKGVLFTPLTEAELTGLKQYVQQIKFVGATVYCKSLPADRLLIVADTSSPIYFDDRFTTANQILLKLQESLIKYLSSLSFDSYICRQGIIDAMWNTEYIRDMGANIRVYISHFDDTTSEYSEFKELNGLVKPNSGYFTLLGSNGLLTVNAENLTILPVSQLGKNTYFNKR